MKSIESRRRLYTVALWAETAWLVILGFLLLEYVQSGEIRLLLSPAWNWLEATAGLLGIGIGAGAVLMERERRDSYIDVCCRSGGPADPVYRLLGVALLTGVLAAGVVVPGRSLTAGVQTAGDSQLVAYTPSGDAEFELVREKKTGERNFEDWLVMTAEDPEPEHYRGEEVNINGMVVVLDGLHEGEFYLTRYLITHCIACARPVGFLCGVGEGMEVPDTDDWVEVSGRFEAGELKGERVPLIMVEDYRIVERPADPYVFP